MPTEIETTQAVADESVTAELAALAGAQLVLRTPGSAEPVVGPCAGRRAI